MNWWGEKKNPDRRGAKKSKIGKSHTYGSGLYAGIRKGFSPYISPLLEKTKVGAYFHSLHQLFVSGSHLSWLTLAPRYQATGNEVFLHPGGV